MIPARKQTGQLRKTWSGTFFRLLLTLQRLGKHRLYSCNGYPNIANDPQFQGFRGLGRLLLVKSPSHHSLGDASIIDDQTLPGIQRAKELLPPLYGPFLDEAVS